MASQDVAAAPPSRLAQIQMKFQQRQQLEREQKKLALTAALDNGNETKKAPSKASIGNGKVRQMFDERRRGAGIDRSHPLKPITSTTSTISRASLNATQPGATRRAATNGSSINTNTIPPRRGGQMSTIKQITTSSKSYNRLPASPPMNGAGSMGNIFNNNNFDDLENLDNETFPKEFSSLSLSINSTHAMGSLIDNDRNNNGLGDSKDIFDATYTTSPTNRKMNGSGGNGIKLNPVITKKSPSVMGAARGIGQQVHQQQQQQRTSPTNRASASGNGIRTNGVGAVKSPVKKPSTTTTTSTAVRKTPTTRSKVPEKPATFKLSVKPPPRVITPPPGMATCGYCHRNFNEDRLSKHEDVCKKMDSKKRKIFDASKHRVKGTEAEKYVKKGTKTTAPVAVAQRTSTVAAASKTQTDSSTTSKKSNWRQKHEEFIAAIREAKKVQQYLAKGGKLSDLPPPPPSENPDYIQCPHCSRRFNESAAERHIPKCANMKHNKPKPPPAKKRY